MLKSERCPYCGNKVTRAEYEKVRAKVERELRARLDQEVGAERKKLREELKALRRERKDARREARAWAEEKVRKATSSLRAEVKRLREAKDAAREEGFQAGRRENSRALDLAQERIATLQRQLSRKTSDEFGEWSEQNLFDDLRRAFPEDEIVRLPKRDGGADISQKVRYRGKVCGTIAFECKNVKAWSHNFVAQAKRGAEQLQANHAVIVSTAFPKNAKGFTTLKGVPIVVPTGAVAFVEILRGSMIEMERRGLTERERVEKSKALYEYLRGTAFRSSMQGIVNAATELQEIQKRERKAHEEVWNKQALQLTAIVTRSGQVESKISALLEETPGRAQPKEAVAAV